MKPTILVLCFLLSSCGLLGIKTSSGPATEWKWVVPPGTTNEKIDKDNYECQREAAVVPPRYWGRYTTNVDYSDRNNLQRACLKARGYKWMEVPVTHEAAPASSP